MKRWIAVAVLAVAAPAFAQTGYFTDTQVPGHIDVIPTLENGTQYPLNSFGQIIVPNVPGATFTITVSGEGTIMCGGRQGCGSVASDPKVVTLTEPDGTAVSMTETQITVLSGTGFATVVNQFISEPIIAGTYQLSYAGTEIQCFRGSCSNGVFAEHYGITGTMTQSDEQRSN